MYVSRKQWLCLADAAICGDAAPMTVIERTTYPRFKQVLTAKCLAEVYTLIPQELFLTHHSNKVCAAEWDLLVLLEFYQRLDRFLPNFWVALHPDLFCTLF